MSSTPNPTPSSSSSSSSSPFSSDNKVLFPGYKHVEQFGPDGDYEYKRKRRHKHKHKGKGRGVDGEDEDEDEDEEDEEEIEEEECYITLDLSNVDQTLASSCSSYRLVGLDTPTPLFQLSKTKTIMKGQLRTLIGTELIFKHASNSNSGSGSGSGSGSEDPNTTTSNTTSNTNTTNTSNTNSNIQYFTKTSNRIHFREVLLQPTKAKSGDESNTDEELHAVAVAAAAAGGGTSTTNENTEPEPGPAATTPRPSNAAQDTSRSRVSEFVSESQAEQDIQPHNGVGDSLLAVQTYRPMDVD